MATNNQRFRVLLNGCGGMGKFWGELLLTREDVEIVAAVDIDRTRAVALLEESKLEKAVPDDSLECAIEATSPDIMVDASIPAAHCEATIKALGMGVHVLGEKPLATSAEEARRMIDAANQANRIYGIVQNRRFDGNLDRLCSFLKSGAIGDVLEVHSDFYTALPGGGFRGEMAHVLLEDMAVHTFDTARVVCAGNGKCVFSKDWNPKGSWFGGGASALALFQMDNGIIYTYRGCWITIGRATSWQANWRIVGTKGSVTWNGDGEILAEELDRVENGWRHARELLVPEIRMPELNGHAACLDDFLESLRVGRKPRSWCEDNFHTFAMSLAAVESCESGVEVGVPKIEVNKGASNG